MGKGITRCGICNGNNYQHTQHNRQGWPHPWLAAELRTDQMSEKDAKFIAELAEMQKTSAKIAAKEQAAASAAAYKGLTTKLGQKMQKWWAEEEEIDIAAALKGKVIPYISQGKPPEPKEVTISSTPWHSFSTSFDAKPIAAAFLDGDTFGAVYANPRPPTTRLNKYCLLRAAKPESKLGAHVGCTFVVRKVARLRADLDIATIEGPVLDREHLCLASCDRYRCDYNNLQDRTEGRFELGDLVFERARNEKPLYLYRVVAVKPDMLLIALVAKDKPNEEPWEAQEYLYDLAPKPRGRMIL